MTTGGGLDIFLSICDHHDEPQEACTNDTLRYAMTANFQQWKRVESMHICEDSLTAFLDELEKNVELKTLLDRVPRDMQAGRVVGAFSHNIPLFVTVSACYGTQVYVRYVRRAVAVGMFDYPVALADETVSIQLFLDQKIREANQQLRSDEGLL